MSSFVIYSLFEKISKIVGVPLAIDFDNPIIIYHRDYDEEIDHAFTGFGYAATFISIMVSARIGMAFNTIDFRGGVSKKSECTFIAWFLGLALYGAASGLLYRLWKNFHGTFANVIFNISDLALAVIIFFFFSEWRDKRLANLKNENP